MGEEPGGLHPTYLLRALQNSRSFRAGRESQVPSWQMDGKGSMPNDLDEPGRASAGKRDCPSGSDFPPEGSETLLYMSLVASSALCSNAVNMAAITHRSFHLSPHDLCNQPHIPTLQISG